MNLEPFARRFLAIDSGRSFCERKLPEMDAPSTEKRDMDMSIEAVGESFVPKLSSVGTAVPLFDL